MKMKGIEGEANGCAERRAVRTIRNHGYIPIYKGFTGLPEVRVWAGQDEIIA